MLFRFLLKDNNVKLNMKNKIFRVTDKIQKNMFVSVQAKIQGKYQNSSRNSREKTQTQRKSGQMPGNNIEKLFDSSFKYYYRNQS